jgi:hypothetical protein
VELTIIDSDMNLFKVEKDSINTNNMKVISQVANETEYELLHELGTTYLKQVENGLIKALDKLSELDKDFDYYDTLRELTGFGNFEALDFLDMFSDNEEEE